MSVVSWVARKACGAAFGPVVGPMVCMAGGAIVMIDKTFSEQDRHALEVARDRNGGCDHILLAFSSQPFSEGSVGEANAGDRKKTISIGKRFSYSDIPRCFWHPSIKFLPDGNVERVDIGVDEIVPPQPTGPTLGAAPPVKGRPTCPLCSKKTEEAMKEMEKYLNWDRQRTK